MLGGNEIYLAPLGQYLKIIQWSHLNARNIVRKNLHVLALCNYMVSMATHNVILKIGSVPTKKAHISAATHARIINFVPNQTVHTFLSFADRICKFVNMHIHEY